MLSYDDFADELSAPGLQNKANIVQSTKVPIKKEKNPTQKRSKFSQINFS